MSRSFDKPQLDFSQTEATLLDNGLIETDFIDMANVDKYQLSFSADVSGLNIELISKPTLASADFSTGVGEPYSGRLYLATLPPRDRYIKFILRNLTGSTVNNANLSVKLKVSGSDGASVLPLERAPTNFSGAMLTQSVLIGRDSGGEYRNTSVNQIGALLTSDFGTEVARDLYEGYAVNTKFGRVPDVDTGTTPEDIYNGGNLYTGFNATGNEEIAVVSGDANDVGSLIASGTVTSGSNTTLVDTGADFITSAVSVGDVVLNDTQGIHGIVISVDSATELTVFEMIDGIADTIVNVAGDTYRIARSTSTGAGVLKLKNILDEDYVEQEDVYVILNGTTTVTTSGVNAMRCSSGRVVIAGNTGKNEGEITVNQATSTSNIFAVIPTFGSTTIGCFTVPAGKDCVIKRVLASITRTSGASGSATMALNARRFGQAFTAEKIYELQTGGFLMDDLVGGITLPPATDVKGTIEDVSDNNTIAQINIEYFLIDRV